MNVGVFEYTAPVGSFAANRFGLYDLGGNVWEWCEDEYGNGRGRVLRGASWNRNEFRCLLSSFRCYDPPGSRVDDFGFRCVLSRASP